MEENLVVHYIELSINPIPKTQTMRMKDRSRDNEKFAGGFEKSFFVGFDPDCDVSKINLKTERAAVPSFIGLACRHKGGQ